MLKNRNGPIGKIELDWIAWRTRFACRGEQPPDPLVVAPTNRETAFDAFSGERHEDSDTREIQKLQQIIDAERHRQRWLAEYVRNGGEFRDRITGQIVGAVK